jgi:hypothetical protein
VVYNGYLYELGGRNTLINTSTVRYARINNDGTVGSWTDTTALPLADVNHSAVAYNGNMYVLGGDTTSTVYYAQINADGSIGSWQSTTVLSGSALRQLSAIVFGGYLYAIAGGSVSGVSTTVSYAPINADGSVGSWADTTALPSALRLQAAAISNGYVYFPAAPG